MPTNLELYAKRFILVFIFFLAGDRKNGFFLAYFFEIYTVLVDGNAQFGCLACYFGNYVAVA